MLRWMTDLFARILFILAVVFSVGFVVSWWNFDGGYARGAFVIHVYTPMVILTWLIGIVLLLASGRGRLAFLHAVLGLVVAIVLALLLLVTANDREAGFIAALVVLAVYDSDQLFVIHETLGRHARRRSPPNTAIS